MLKVSAMLVQLQAIPHCNNGETIPSTRVHLSSGPHLSQRWKVSSSSWRRLSAHPHQQFIILKETECESSRSAKAFRSQVSRQTSVRPWWTLWFPIKARPLSVFNFLLHFISLCSWASRSDCCLRVNTCVWFYIKHPGMWLLDQPLDSPQSRMWWATPWTSPSLSANWRKHPCFLMTPTPITCNARRAFLKWFV